MMDPFGSVTVPLSVAVLVCPSAALKANRRRQTLARKIYGIALLCMIDPLQKLILPKLISGETLNEATDLRKYNLSQCSVLLKCGCNCPEFEGKLGVSVTSRKINTLSQTILYAVRIAFTQTQHLIDFASFSPLPLNRYGVPPQCHADRRRR